MPGSGRLNLAVVAVPEAMVLVARLALVELVALAAVAHSRDLVTLHLAVIVAVPESTRLALETGRARALERVVVAGQVLADATVLASEKARLLVAAPPRPARSALTDDSLCAVP